MFPDFQNVKVFLCILSFKAFLIQSKTTTLWKLNLDKTKIIKVTKFQSVYSANDISKTDFVAEDPLFDIITSTEHYGESWVKQPVQYYCRDCQKNKRNATSASNSSENTGLSDEILDCGKPVNFTYFDNLVGVVNRNRHPIVPEPQAIFCFTKNYGKYKSEIEDFDIDALERKLKKAKREKPKSIQLYNQIGNFWRIKGDASKAIECFRRALAASPHNAEVLLNLARILFSLQYLDDAIYLTRRSLEVQSQEKGAWQQYFTLGEIFKAYGHYQEASIHLRHTLELNPEFEPAQLALKEMETMPAATIHIYTLVIIVCLVLGVLLVILSSVDNLVEYTEDIKPQRHFNKAMAMRSLRGISMTAKRCKRPSI
ncbi:uncharacterized protein LOC130446445 [Diorhabda sublineata]|uniref:uncharacterized protein LOC130446445 n=1 Tax=Diorhabda sublineata TaxID=1163346 RepID=UPI0024E0B2B9|nr:uncharacterized protein LOC130446445 [Diorhabda sublineata]